jgi:predicted  nucleic acid-binding Zn-ribbon protein
MQECVKCGLQYADDAQEIMQGCTCGARAFLFKRNEPAPAKPSDLAIEHVYAEEEGTYEVDLRGLFGSKDTIIEFEEGKYRINLQESFRKHLR